MVVVSGPANDRVIFTSVHYNPRVVDVRTPRIEQGVGHGLIFIL